MNQVIVSGSFDELQSRQASQTVRFLQEAACFGQVHALVWSDQLAARLEGKAPQYPFTERVYFLQALRWVQSYEVIEHLNSPDHLPLQSTGDADCWAVRESEACSEKQEFARHADLELRIIPENGQAVFPAVPFNTLPSRSQKLVMVTGTFDWLHSGHVRFFEEVAGYGKLTVIVGHDANIRLLKGEGHPLFPQEERLYMVQSIRYVHQAMLSTGSGWLDAEPELESLRPDMYAVNEDGDKPEKRAYCEAHGIEYLVLNRRPKEGLSRRSSTDLRGF